MVNEGSEPTSPIIKWGLIILSAFMAIIIGLYYFTGYETTLNLLKILAGITLVVGIIAGVIALLVFLFSKKKFDMLSIRNKQIINSCKQSKSPIKQELWMRGDSFVSTRKIGEVFGFAMEKCAPEKTLQIDKKTNKKILVSDLKSIKPIIFIVFKDGLFSKKKIFVGIEEDITGGFKSLSSPRIFLNGTTFGPTLYEQYFLAKHWENTTLIDSTTKEDVHRYTLQECLREIKTYIDSAIDIDANHAKTKELSNFDNIPLQGGPR